MVKFVNKEFRDYLLRCYTAKKILNFEFPTTNTISIEICRCVYRWLKRRKIYQDYYLYMSWYIIRMIISKGLYNYFNDISNLYIVLYRDYECMMNENLIEFNKCFDEDFENVKKQLFKMSTITESILRSCKFNDCSIIYPEYIEYTFNYVKHNDNENISNNINKIIVYLQELNIQYNNLIDKSKIKIL